MRMPSYLSPTSIKQFDDDTEEFYKKYLADCRPDREPQTQPMSVGSAFDAYVKNDLHKILFGKPKPGFEFEELFESQVESHNRDWARVNGMAVFLAYKKSGAFADLLGLLAKSIGEPQFEARIDGLLLKSGSLDGVPMMGKPDVYFISEGGARIIIDWKVNGYCSRSSVSPMKGYCIVRDGWVGQQSRSHGKTHDGWIPVQHKDITVGRTPFLQGERPDWAAQQAIYAWLLGESVGSDFVVGIEQLVCKPMPPGYPEIRVATHRSFITEQFQLDLEAKIHHIWDVIQSGWIFRDLTEEQSKNLQESFDRGVGESVGEEEIDLWR